MDEAESREALVARLRAARAAGSEEAATLASELRRRFPEAIEGYRIGVAAEIARRDWRAASGVIAAAEARFPHADWIALDSAALARAQGDLEGAAAAAAEARARGPGNPATFWAGSASERERGRFEAAEALLAESRRRFGPRVWIVAERARIAEARGDFAEARRLAGEAETAFPREPDGYRIAIAASRALNDVEAALAIAERAQAQFPDQSWPLATRLSLLRSLGGADEATELAESLRQRFPQDPAGYDAGIGLLRARARLPEALALAEEAARRFPGRADYAAQAAELAGLAENRRRALGLARELAEAPPALSRPRVVVALGMHRTGTSLAARMLGELGVGLGGPLMSGNFANPDGYFEHLDVVAAHDDALRRVGAAWDACWSALPRTPRLGAGDHAETRARLEAVAERELDANGGLWAFKDPRTLRFLPLWREIFDRLGVEPVWILCLRDPRAVAGSLHARDRLPREIGELLWIEHVADALSELGPRLALILRYESWFTAPQEQVRALARAAGRPADGVAAAARAELRHQAPGDEPPELPLSLAMHDALAAPDPDLADLQARARALRRRLRRRAGAAPD